MPAKKILTAKRGRKCKYPGCKSELSVYNHNSYCHADLNKISKRAQWPGVDADREPTSAAASR